MAKFSVEQICGAIDNYVRVLLGADYFWTHVWSLSAFLTVKYERHKTAECKWWQFLPDNFIEENYLTPEAKRRRSVKDQGHTVYELEKEQLKIKRVNPNEQSQTA